jgi:hypothetical protein
MQPWNLPGDPNRFWGLLTSANSSTPPGPGGIPKIVWSAAADLNRAHRGCNSAAHHLLLRRLAPRG